MARAIDYKQYNNRSRRAVLEDDLSKGMMSTEGAVDEGYVRSLVNCAYEKETHAIVPRPGLRLYGTVFPSTVFETDTDFLSDNVTIKASKQCVENGLTYNQIILCKVDDIDPSRGIIWTLTASAFSPPSVLNLDDNAVDIAFSEYILSSASHICYLYTANSPSIHDIYFSEDDYKRINFPVGEFAYGNSYYFLGETALGIPGLFRTYFDTSQVPPRYEFEAVTPKTPSVSEAVTYGYNMLRALPYQFDNVHTGPNTIQFDGILPYEVDSGHTHSTLMMTPKKNQPVDLVCYYTLDTSVSHTYDIIWESRETTASDWTQLKKESVVFGNNTELVLDNFLAQDKEIMVRVSAYTTGSDVIEKAMVVGFDFTIENYGTAKSLEQKNYDLTTATGIENWKNRVVIWGLPEDPTILFLSDYNDPSYFPYPNNIVVFDEPIIYCVEFMDNLAVFTTDKLYQVALSNDGNSWETTILQSHLSIDVWDKHLIQTVRNMLYFKSGNYYYMMVPKAQSTTGELTLAPITTPITSFFDRFSVNVQDILKYAYGYLGNYELLTYYNFLDYEDIHNIYAYKFDDSLAVMHFDVIYNTVDRTWKVWLFEAPTLIFPFKQQATRSGLYASTSIIIREDVSESYATSPERIVQVYCWDKMLVKSCYIPSNTHLLYNPEDATSQVDNYVLDCNDEFAYIEDGVLVFISDLYAVVEVHTLEIQDAADFYAGYSKTNIFSTIKNVYSNQDGYYTFSNYQYIDSGYRNDELQYKKRYREVQFQINNLDQKDMQFGMDYILDGAPRGIFYKYETTQAIDEMDPDYGIVYIDSTPYMETDLDDIDLTNQWTLDQGLMPEVTLWKIRVAVSGKGYAPRVRLYSRNEKRFELLNVAWISKLMHMR